jgi:hypothetical protein
VWTSVLKLKQYIQFSHKGFGPGSQKPRHLRLLALFRNYPSYIRAQNFCYRPIDWRQNFGDGSEIIDMSVARKVVISPYFASLNVTQGRRDMYMRICYLYSSPDIASFPAE